MFKENAPQPHHVPHHPNPEAATPEAFENPALLKILDTIEKQRNLKPKHLYRTGQSDESAKSLGADLDYGAVGGAERVVYQKAEPGTVVVQHEREYEVRRHSLGMWDTWELTSVALNQKEERARFIRQHELIKILRILFPDQIPDIRGVFNRKAATKREKISGRSVTSDGTFTGSAFTRAKLSFACRKLGLRIDADTQNFIRDEHNDRLVYIDNIYEFEHPEVISQKIEEAAANSPSLSEGERAELARRLERFKKLSPKLH